MGEVLRLDGRDIVRRIVVRGTLELLKPAHWGNGDTDDLVDMPLFLDEDGNPLLKGSTVAGRLRSYLREWEFGYFSAALEKFSKDRQFEEERRSLSVCLLGGMREDEEGDQSPLIVDPSVGTKTGVELRDFVAIDSESGAAKPDHKFDMELLEAGTTFPLRFELLVCEGSDKRLLCALALALQGFEREEIRVGARTSKGFGRCKVSNWRVWNYDLVDPEHLLAWLACEHEVLREEYKIEPRSGGSIAELLKVQNELQAPEFEDKREHFKLDLEFGLVDSLLIRSGTGPDDLEVLPDSVHQHSRQSDGTYKPVLTGTGLGGALRHHAPRIAKTVSNDDSSAHTLVEEVFGTEMSSQTNLRTGAIDGQQQHASHLQIEENVIDKAQLLVQYRILIDRLTGGVYPGALFNEGAIFGLEDTVVPIHLLLKNPLDNQIGLMLYLLKDLWTEFLPLGGEQSVGRGRLSGRSAKLYLRRMNHKELNRTKEWQITQSKDGISISGDFTASEMDEKFALAARQPLPTNVSRG